MRTAFGSSLLVGVAAFALAAACGGTTSSAGAGAYPGNLPCAVDAVLAANCRQCHGATPQFGAPMSLVTLSDLHQRAKSDSTKYVYELVPVRIADDKNPMPQPPNARLSDADRATLTMWAEQGGLAGDDGCAAPVTPTTDPSVTSNDDGGLVNNVDAGGVACKPDLDLAPASPWTMPDAAGDKYVCYGVDVVRPSPTHVVAFAPRIDNTKIVHHAVLFQSSSSYPSTPQECDGGTSLQWRMVMGWAPGNTGFQLPPDVGFAVASGTAEPTHYVMQVHYSNPQGLTGQTDTSGFSLCTTTPRKYEADVVAFGTQNIKIPPGGVAYTTDCSLKASGALGSSLAGMHVIGTMPHMHKIGTAMSTVIEPAGGGPPIDIGTDTSFSFGSQPWLTYDATIGAGDNVRTKCTWTNNTGAEVDFGEYTADEMCYSFTMYYPKIQSPFWSWAAPANLSTCAK